MNELYQQLLKAGHSPADIPKIIGQLAAQAQSLKARLLANRFPQSYVDGLSMAELFNLGQKDVLPLATGQNELNREAEGRRDLETGLGNRANAGTSLATILEQERADRMAAEKDTFRLPEALANLSRLPMGSGGNPLQTLLGEGTYIDPQFTEDPMLTELKKRLMEYARTSPAEDPQIAATRAAYLRAPVDAARYFGASEEDRQRLGHASGGSYMLHEPVVGVGAESGDVLFTAAENGPEGMDVGKRGMRFRPMPGVARSVTPSKQRAIVGKARWPVPAAAKGSLFKFDMQGAIAKNRAASRSQAVKDQANADALKGYQGPVEPDGSFVINGTRYSGNTGKLAADGRNNMTAGQMEDIYSRGARQNRYGADPLSYSTGGAKTGYAGGSMLTPEDREYYEKRRAERIAALTEPPAFEVPSKGTDAGGGFTGPRAAHPTPLYDNTPMPTPPRGTTTMPAASARRPYTSPFLGLKFGGGGSLRLREATARAVGKSLQGNPFAHPDMTAALLAGRAPVPGSITKRFRENVDPTILSTLLNSVMPAFGFQGESVLREARTFDPRGLGIVSVRR